MTYRTSKPGEVPSKRRSEDSAVSPVIAVILMVAITVVLAAVVYIWVRDASETNVPSDPAAAHVKTIDADGDTLEDTVKILLVKGPNAPYGFAFDGGGNLLDHGPNVAFGDAGVTDLYTDSSLTSPIDATTRWNPGMSLYAACPNPGDVAVTVKIDGTIVYDGEVECRE